MGLPRTAGGYRYRPDGLVGNPRWRLSSRGETGLDQRSRRFGAEPSGVCLWGLRCRQREWNLGRVGCGRVGIFSPCGPFGTTASVAPTSVTSSTRSPRRKHDALAGRRCHRLGSPIASGGSSKAIHKSCRRELTSATSRTSAEGRAGEGTEFWAFPLRSTAAAKVALWSICRPPQRVISLPMCPRSECRV
jgi:hypothetical protein